MKPRISHVIPMLILSLSLTFTPKVYAVDNNMINNMIIAENTNNQKSNQKSMNQAFEDLKNAMKSFNDDLKTVINDKKGSLENINSQNILEKLDNLQQQIKSLSNNSQLPTIVNDINSTITDIDKILKPLRDGFSNKGNITQIQKELGFFQKRNIPDRYYGTFGKTTQEELEIFTNNKLEELEKQIKSLNSAVNTQGVTAKNPIISSTKNTINKVKNDGVNINDVNSSLNKLTITVIILGFISLGLILFCIYRIITLVEEQRRLRGLLPPHQTNQKFIDIDNFQVELNEVYRRLNNFDERLKQIERNYQNQNYQTQNYQNSSFISSNVTPISRNTQPIEPVTSNSYQAAKNTPTYLANTNIQLVSTYNISPRALSEQATTVSESEYTAEQRRLGRNISPLLECHSRGNYWIITEGNNEYLVPKANMKINEHNYLTISTFFNCLGYNHNSPNNFTLIKPAKVSKRGEEWELIEVGELQF